MSVSSHAGICLFNYTTNQGSLGVGTLHKTFASSVTSSTAVTALPNSATYLQATLVSSQGFPQSAPCTPFSRSLLKDEEHPLADSQPQLLPSAASTPHLQTEFTSAVTIEWLHIPKAGTSFGNTLLLWACPALDPQQLWWPIRPGQPRPPVSCMEKFRPGFGRHVSLEGRTQGELRRVVAMLRSPGARLVSLHHYLRTQHNPSYRSRLGITPSATNATEGDICSWLASSRWAADAQGAMVKTIAGVPRGWHPGLQKYSFPDAEQPPQALVREACRRLQLFMFVGITDYWHASVCLFHAQHGGVVRPVELENVRQGRCTAQHCAVREVHCGDAADQQLFACALELFWQRLEEHRHCQREMPPGAVPLAVAPSNGVGRDNFQGGNDGSSSSAAVLDATRMV